MATRASTLGLLLASTLTVLAGCAASSNDVDGSSESEVQSASTRHICKLTAESLARLNAMAELTAQVTGEPAKLTEASDRYRLQLSENAAKLFGETLKESGAVDGNPDNATKVAVDKATSRLVYTDGVADSSFGVELVMVQILDPAVAAGKDGAMSVAFRARAHADEALEGTERAARMRAVLDQFDDSPLKETLRKFIEEMITGNYVMQCAAQPVTQ